MYELDKIEEAQYFYSQMLKEASDRDHFKHNLSAFLTAGRSVLQYALEEAQGKKKGQSWYDSQLSQNAVVKFFSVKHPFLWNSFRQRFCVMRRTAWAAF